MVAQDVPQLRDRGRVILLATAIDEVHDLARVCVAKFQCPADHWGFAYGFTCSKCIAHAGHAGTGSKNDLHQVSAGPEICH